MSLSTAASITSDLAASAAVFFGGIWAYFKFARGRTFATRADLKVTPEYHKNDPTDCLLIGVSLQNKGTSRILLDQEVGQLLEISGADSLEPQQAINWTLLHRDTVFPSDHSVESLEDIYDEVLAPIPHHGLNGAWIAFKINVEITTKKRWWKTYADGWSGFDVFYPSGVAPTLSTAAKSDGG